MGILEKIFLEGFVVYFLAGFLSAKILCDKWYIKAPVFGLLGGGLYVLLFMLNFAFFGEILLTILVVILGVLITNSSRYLTKILTNLCFIIFILGTKKVAEDNFGERATLLKSITIVVSVGVVWALSAVFYNIKRQKKFEYKITIKYGDNASNCIAYLDSGNTLMDNSGLPVVIIDYKTFLHLTNINFFDFVGGNFALKNSHYIEYGTVGKRGKMLVFEPDEMLVDGEKKQCFLGLSVGANFGEYPALLNVMMVN